MLLNAGANPYWECNKGLNGAKLPYGVTTLELATDYLDQTQNHPSIIERLCPCYRKKRIRNLKEIISILTAKMEAIAHLAKEIQEEPAGNIIPTNAPQQALDIANATYRTNLALQLKRINNSYQQQENDDDKEPGTT